MNVEDAIQEVFNAYNRDDKEMISTAYGDGGTDLLFPRLERAALNQIGDGAAMFSRYAIWANTLRDNIRHAIKLLNDGDQLEAERFLTRAINCLSAFSDIQAICDPRSRNE